MHYNLRLRVAFFFFVTFLNEMLKLQVGSKLYWINGSYNVVIKRGESVDIQSFSYLRYSIQKPNAREATSLFHQGIILESTYF